ncbi:glycosyltransferase family 4 protein [Amycolatopsis ultiminotia]|uniref:Glycosyltransferase family 4 protein n=1 Tax=Amycolatopsis ultiminotia TaxID=543629 RepID=A0ABP6WPA7_9PSEU
MPRPHVLVIVQNLPVPLDRRVWLECRALTESGYEVSVICPRGEGDPAYEVLEGVHLHKYRPAPAAGGVFGYLLEFSLSWLRTAWLSRKVWRRRPFEVLQACNPPDTYWLLARFWQRRGVRFVFDHHDLNPEVFRSRFGEPATPAARAQLAGLHWLERMTFRTADHVISTNTSYQRIAVERGGVPIGRTSVVRSGPDTTVMRPGRPESALRRGRRHLVVWLGIMGPQDGVDVVLDIARRTVFEHGREDVQFAVLGFGDCLEELRRRCTALGLDDYLDLPGRVGPAQIAEYFSTASAGLSPDPRNPLNDVSTMNKTMEYLAFGVPVVAYRLTENAISAGDCAVYTEPGDAAGFTAELVALLDDPDRRADLAKRGRLRAERDLDWAPQAHTYVSVYDRLLRRSHANEGN